jgi:hypothetical protein
MTRPRGFITWTPTPTVDLLVGNVQNVLHENRDILPLTLRQIFYMLVSGYGYDKTEKAYKRLCEAMNKARRASMVPMDMIRDDGLRREDPHSWSSEAALVRVIKESAAKFRLPRQRGQDIHVMVWCEAGGMVPQLANYCDEYGVTVISSGGFDSVTTKHDFAKRCAEEHPEGVEVLHIGDHDPSGVHMCSSLDEDLNAFVDAYGGYVEVTRLAVTPEQVAEMDLPTAPPKRTDRREFYGETTQAEAIPPRRLREIVQDAIVERFDMEIYESVLDEEKEIRASMHERLKNL